MTWAILGQTATVKEKKSRNNSQRFKNVYIYSILHAYSGTAHALEVLKSQENLERAPSVETCIQWEMKVGLHKLTQPKAIADDWIWIMDHVVYHLSQASV